VAGVRVALVTARAARGLDGDEAPLQAALLAAGCSVEIVDWDDVSVDWRTFEVALLRSAWDYAERIAEFLSWAERVSSLTRLLNPLPVVRWNTDKHYLAELGRAGVATVPSWFVEPGEDASLAVKRAWSAHSNPELVVKPAIGAGSRDARRHRRSASPSEAEGCVAHVQSLLDAGRSVLLQPYLARVDQDGETALIFFEGVFSHAIRKGPLLPAGGTATKDLFAAETIEPRVPGADEMRLAEKIVSAIPGGLPLYARVDLIKDDAGAPVLLEVELNEPSLFFAQAPGSVEGFTAALFRALLL
jgi:glutathione synthase/RimK-type ligase-like ATP-grasp enzyme